MDWTQSAWDATVCLNTLGHTHKCTFYTHSHCPVTETLPSRRYSKSAPKCLGDEKGLLPHQLAINQRMPAGCSRATGLDLQWIQTW